MIHPYVITTLLLFFAISIDAALAYRIIEHRFNFSDTLIAIWCHVPFIIACLLFEQYMFIALAILAMLFFGWIILFIAAINND